MAFDNIKPNYFYLEFQESGTNGTTAYYRRVYTPEKTYTERAHNFNGSDKNRLGDYVKDVDYHNLGVCPVCVFTNLPFTYENFYQTNNLIQFNLTSLNNFTNQFFKFNFQNDSAYTEELQNVINHLIIVLCKEAEYGRTRVVKNGVNQEEVQTEEGMRQNMSASDFIQNTRYNNQDIKIIQNSNKLAEIQNAIDTEIEHYFNNSGYAFYKMNGGNQKSAGEVQVIMFLTILTNRVKAKLLSSSIKDMI
jgi:hypothetical protein